jgi:hypothetical protein
MIFIKLHNNGFNKIYIVDFMSLNKVPLTKKVSS